MIFEAIEGEGPLHRTANARRLREATAHRLWQVACCTRDTLFNQTAWNNRVGEVLVSYQNSLVNEIRLGWDGAVGGADDSEPKQWSFSGAFLYSLTVITTIGYGNITPRTEWGKVTTIFYAIIGMPIFLLYLSNIGDILARSFKWTYAMACLCRGCPGVSRRRAARHTSIHNGLANWEWDELSDVGWQEPIPTSPYFDPQNVTVPITLCVAIMVGYIGFGATLFSKWEDWNMIDASYFCFISLTSIGFGDIVPGDQMYAAEKIEISFIVCSLYLLLGMALIAMCFNLMQEQVIHNISAVKRALRRICRCKI